MADPPNKNMRKQRAGFDSYLNKLYLEKVAPCIENPDGMSSGDCTLIGGYLKMFNQKLLVITDLNAKILETVDQRHGRERLELSYSAIEIRPSTLLFLLKFLIEVYCLLP